MQRIQSIDIFRGLTIFVMVFVNDLAGVSGLPAWMYHVPADADAMTFVDVVFPAFLIIVGMSIPLAVTRRLDKGDSVLQIYKHILIRSFGLIVLGVFMVNAEEMNVDETLIPSSWWNVLLYLSAILIWNQYPRVDQRRKNLSLGLQLLGVVTLMVLAFLFRKGEPGELTGLTASWWGILGLIGWAYLISTTAYLIIRNNLALLLAVFVLFIFVAIGLMSPDLELPVLFEWLKGQASHIVHAALAISGIILTLLLQRGASDESGNTQIKWILSYGAFCYLTGFFLRPLYGISKIHATPTWALYSIASCCLVFVLIHWLVEVKGIKRWADFLKPAGKNPLLTYILPYLFYAAIGLSFLPAIFNTGLLGLMRSVVFTLFILGVAGLLTKWNIRLKL